MDKDYSELIQYLDQKFTRVDERFVSIDKKFDHVDKRFDDIKKDYIDLQTSVDAYAHKADAYFQEMVMMSHDLKRHEKWIRQLADKLGVKLEY